MNIDLAPSAPFLDAIFRYADPSSWVALRVFPHNRGEPAKWLVDIRSGDRAALLATIERGIRYAARATAPMVFSPVTGCTFTRPGTAKTRDIAQGLALAVEVDEGETDTAGARIEALIGAATVVIRSGSEWADPKTGVLYPKRHIYWRLSEPTATEAEHVLLYSARRDAALLASADPTGAAVAHCYRWPGSVNRKTPDRPALCTIERLNPEAEIHLIEAADLLAETVGGIGRRQRGSGAGYQGQQALAADPALVAAAITVIPNPDLHYDEWIRWGYAVCGATAGQHYNIWHAWSAKSAKHDDADTEATWQRIRAAGVQRIGAGSIFAEAKLYGWVMPPAHERLWSQAVPVPDTLAAKWLKALRLPGLIDCPSLRFAASCHHPSGVRLPALLAAMRSLSGELVAVQRLYLDPDGRAPAAIDPPQAMLGPPMGAAIWLSPVEDVVAAGEVVVGADIIETAALGVLLGRQAWAAAIPANLAAGIALPPDIHRVVIAAEPDGDNAAHAAWRRFKREGRSVETATPVDAASFNAMLLGGDDGHD